MNDTRVTNLHSLWDSGLITVRVRRDFQSDANLYYEHILALMRNQSRVVDNDDSIDQWITENIKFVCSQIYLDENGAVMNASANFTLGNAYYAKNIQVVEQRLAHGGRRLGALLNRLATRRPKPPREPLCSGTIALIAVLAVECVIGIGIGAYFGYRRFASGRRRLS